MTKGKPNKSLQELLAEIADTVKNLPEHLQQAAFTSLLNRALELRKMGIGNHVSQQLSRSQLEAATTFGDYYSSFPSEISEEEKLLVAASFAEAASEDKTFTVRSANQLLKEIGVKLSNAGTFARQLKQKKLIFPLGKSRKKEFKLRVSRLGHELLKQLTEQRQ